MSLDSSNEAVVVLVPMLNPNEPDAVLVERTAAEGQAVRAGDVLCVLETSKSTEELTAEADGYVVGWQAEATGMVSAGDVLCYLAPTPDWTPPPSQTAPPPSAAELLDSLPEGLRISQPALALARANGIDMARLPLGQMVTVTAVQALLGQGHAAGSTGASIVSSATAASGQVIDPTALVVYGGAGHGKTLIELVRARGTHRVMGVIDNELSPEEAVLGVPLLGGDSVLAELRARGVALAVNGVGGIARVADRVRVFERLAAAGFSCPVLIHPSAVVEASANLGAGVQVFAQAYVGSEASLGVGTIVNTGSVVSHECVLDDYVNISPGAMLAGKVAVGAMTLVGMGVTVNIGVRVGTRVRIGNAAVVKTDIPDNQVVPAGSIWPPR